MSDFETSDLMKPSTTDEKKEVEKAAKVKSKKAPAPVPPKNEKVRYLSTKKNLRVRIRPPIKKEINGRIFREPGLAANFQNYSMTTKDPEVIEALDEMLTGEGAMRWRKVFYRAPSDRMISTMTKAAEAAREKEKEILEKSLGDDGMKEMDEWNQYLSRHKSDMSKIVAGRHAMGT